MSSTFILSKLAEASISGRVLEGCKSACQYALDRLQGKLNSLTVFLPLVCVAAFVLLSVLMVRKKQGSKLAYDAPVRLDLWIIPGLIALATSLLRFILEKASVSQALAELAGIGWLTIPVAVYLALRVQRWRELIINLALFVMAARVPVVMLMLLASNLHWGTHYDISSLTHLDTQWGRLNYEPNSFRQHLHIIYIAQLIIMPIYSIATGMIAGTCIFILKMLRVWYQARTPKKVAFNGQRH
ncbi:MAG TPA: hypothetical protein VMW38_09200 [Terriglobia bacterium]|nr:hypothetical protein [Terriglobia bacterium]